MLRSSGLAAVSAAILSMNRQLEVRDVLQTIVTSARDLLDAQYAALGVPDDHGGFAQFVVDGVTDDQWKAIGPLPRQHGVLAAMLHEATPQRLADVRTDPRFEGWPRAHPELADFLGMPIADGQEVLGALFLANKECGARGAKSAQDAESAEGAESAEDAEKEPGGANAGGAAPVRGCAFTEEDEQLLRLLAQHAAIALTNARLYERSRELTIAGERARIGHDLHDAVAQKLFSLRLTAQAAAALVDRDPARAKDELHEIGRLAGEASEELRAAVVELRPAALDEDGLVATLRAQTHVLDRAHSAEVTFVSEGALRALPAAQEEALLRVAQEALHNALRHAAASRVGVTLAYGGSAGGSGSGSGSGSVGGGGGAGARLRVTDDGRGFDPRAVRKAGRHLGLVSMRDRASGVGGTLTVESEPGKGAVIELEVPGG